MYVFTNAHTHTHIHMPMCACVSVPRNWQIYVISKLCCANRNCVIANQFWNRNLISKPQNMILKLCYKILVQRRDHMQEAQASIISNNVLKRSAKNAIPIETSKTILKDTVRADWHGSSQFKFWVKTHEFQLTNYSRLPAKNQVGRAFLRHFKNAHKWQRNSKLVSNYSISNLRSAISNLRKFADCAECNDFTVAITKLKFLADNDCMFGYHSRNCGQFSGVSHAGFVHYLTQMHKNNVAPHTHFVYTAFLLEHWLVRGLI